MRSTKTFEALRDLLGGFLNEDVFEYYATIEEAVDDFARVQRHTAPRLRADVGAILEQCQDDLALQTAVEELGLQVLPLVDGWPSYRAWLLAMADRVDAVLRTQHQQ